MGEIIFVALTLSVPLWLIVNELAEINKHLRDDDEDEGEGGE
jgi:hypothetical protein